jgi:hypothetical protein
MAYVTADERETLRALQATRDREAQELGVLTLHWFAQIRKADLAILRAEQAQRRAGEEALRAHGFDPDAEDLTINLESGAILRATAGGWVATE